MKKARKGVALLLILAMVVTMVPVGSTSAYAATGGTVKISKVDGSYVLQAVADRGYVFDHWAAGDDTSCTEDTYPIAEIELATGIRAVFKENTKNTVTAAVSPAESGTLKYTIYDIYGKAVEGEENEEYTEPFDMYKGESVEFTAFPASGSMVEQWILKSGDEETVFVSSSKKYPGGKIVMEDSPIEIETVMVSSQTYNLSFEAGGETAGGSVTASADGEAITTGTAVTGGSDIVFTAAPDENMMVDYWTVTDGESETVVLKDADGNVFVDPVYSIDGLKGDKLVRVYFKALETKDIHISGSNAAADISYVTPVKTGSEETYTYVRTGGTVKLTITPAECYASCATDVADAFSRCCEKVTAEYRNGAYNVVLKGIRDNIDVDLDDITDKLVSVTASGTNYSMGDITSSKTADGAGSGMVRSGSDISFKLTAANGYMINTAAADAWASSAEGVSLTVNAYNLADVSISNILCDVTVPDNLFRAIPSSSPSTGGSSIGVNKEQDSEGNEIVSVSAEAETVMSEDGSTAILSLTDKQCSALIEKAAGTNADVISFSAGEVTGGAASFSVVLGPEFLKDILEKTGAALSIETPAGAVQMVPDAMQSILEQLDSDAPLNFNIKNLEADSYSKITGNNAYVVSMDLLSGEKKITTFDGGKLQLKFEVPDALAGKEITAVYISDTNKVEKFSGKAVTAEDATYYVFETGHLSVYALVQKVNIESYEKSQKIIAGVGKTVVKLSAKASDNGIKLSWKKSKGYKVDGYEIFRKASKNRRYIKIYTTKKASTLSHTNFKSLKSGKKYYYKVRGVRTVNGKKYYTKWSNICSKKYLLK